MNFEVRTDSLTGTATAVGWARGHTVVIDRPSDGGGQDLGFNGGELLHLAIAGCVSNDLFREARILGLRLTRVAITARGEFSGSPQTSAGIAYSVEVWGDAPAAALRPGIQQEGRWPKPPSVKTETARVSRAVGEQAALPVHALGLPCPLAPAASSPSSKSG